MSEKHSIKGMNFKNEPLAENNLNSGTKVIWRNKIYETGNRYHDSVELFRDGKFIRTSSMRHVRLVGNQKQ